MRSLLFLGGIVFLIALTSCATPVRWAGKTALIVVKTGVGMVWNVAKLIGRIGTKGSPQGADLMADPTLQSLATAESRRVADEFWKSIQAGTIDPAYQMFSQTLKRKFKKRAFAAYVHPWAGHLKGYEVQPPTVQQFHVEVPTRLYVEREQTVETVEVAMYISKIADRWQITGWEASTDGK